MKVLFGIVTVVVVSQFFFAVPFTSAAESGLFQLAGCSGPDCTACNVVDLANGLITWLIGIVFLLFVVLVVVAGVRMVMSGGSHHALDEAKGMFVNAIIGLVIILAAWLIVDTIMRVLLPDGKIQYVTGWLYWSEVQCQVVQQPGYNPGDTLQLAYSVVQTQITTSLNGVGSWRAGSDGVPVSSCTIVGYFGTSPTYDCSAQISECKNSGPSESVLVNNGAAVSCEPSGDIAIGLGGGNGANCPAAPESSMVLVPGTSAKARSDVAQNFVRMRAAAASDGVNLIINEGWRDEATQLSYWYKYNCDKVSCAGSVAKPCSLGGSGSNHQQGEAFDISLKSDSKALPWLQSNAGRFGFYNHLPRDLVHWSLTGG